MSEKISSMLPLSKKELEDYVQSLEDENYQLREVIDNVPGDIYWKDKKGGWLGINKRGLNSLKKMGFASKLDDIVGKTDGELFGEQTAAQFTRHDERVMWEEREYAHEESAILPSGKKVEQLSTKYPLYNSNGEIIGIVGNTVDVTHLKEVERSLREVSRKAEISSHAKSEFISNMSHDLRTPMTGVSGMLELIQLATEKALKPIGNVTDEYGKTFENTLIQVQEYALIAKQSSSELIHLFNEILDMVKLETAGVESKPKIFDLHHLIQRNYHLFSSMVKHKELNLSYKILDSVPPCLEGFSIYLERCLSNLISNALKFTSKGSAKIFVTDIDSSTNCRVGDAITIEISITDTGIGIPEDKFDTIFESFLRLTSSYNGIYKGVGIGLYMVKRYVELMNGKITVESKVGEGSRFTLRLPFIVADPASCDTNDSAPEKDLIPEVARSTDIEKKRVSDDTKHQKFSILVVEDSLPAATAVRGMLKLLNCSTHLAQSGSEAIKMAAGNDYHLILMDIGLPDFNGIEATKQIRALDNKKRAQLPIVALTGHGKDSQIHQETLDAGVQEILEKPVMFPDLKTLLQCYISDFTSEINNES